MLARIFLIKVLGSLKRRIVIDEKSVDFFVDAGEDRSFDEVRFFK